MSFQLDLARLIQRAEGRVDDVVRASTLRMGRQVVLMSPVDTGRFKGNWVYGANKINPDNQNPPDKSGGSSVTRLVTGVAAWKAGETMYFTNSLPYAKRLEYGYSQQAANGMVRLAVQNWQDWVSAEARKAK